MKIHTIFVEPAQYTLDLVSRFYEKNPDMDYSFVYTHSLASNEDLDDATYFCFSRNSKWKSLQFLNQQTSEKDLIIVNGYNHWFFFFLYVKTFFNPNFFLAIESDTQYKPISDLKGLLKRLYLKMIFSHKRVLGLAGGNFSHKDLFQKQGMSKERIFLMPMSVDNNKFFNENRSLKCEVPILLFVGRLIPIKGIDLLLRAFKNVTSKGYPAKLQIVGDGISKQELKKLAGNDKNISFEGKKYGQELIDFYHQADILVLPSRNEPWGLVVNEALSAGLAVLCSNAVGAVDDLVIIPDSGWVFKSSDLLNLEITLEKILKKPELIKKKAENGNQFMKTYWNLDLYESSLELVKNYVKSH